MKVRGRRRVVPVVKGTIEVDWSAAFANHADAVYHLALVVLRNAEDARDCMQSVFERAWSHRDRYDADRPLRPWLLAIAGHEAISAARRRRVRGWVTLGHEQPAPEPPREVSLALW